MTNQISYQKKNDDIECVHYKNWTKAYPPHTHAEHLTLGIVEDGSVCMGLHPISFKFSVKFEKPRSCLKKKKASAR